MRVKKNIIAIRENNYLGKVLNFYSVSKNDNKEYYSDIEVIKNEDNFNLTHSEKKIIKLISEYNDNQILRIFNKKKKLSIQDFFNSINQEFFESKIRGYVEIRLKKIIDIAIEHDIPIYYKSGKNIYEDDRILSYKNPAQAIFNFTKENDHTEYFLSIRQNNTDTHLYSKGFQILVKNPAYVVINSKLHIFKDIDSKKLLPFFIKKNVRIEKRMEKTYYEKFILNSLKNYHVNAVGFNIELLNIEPKLKIEFSTNLDSRLAILPYFYYNDFRFPVHIPPTPKIWMQNTEDNYSFKKLIRNTEKEKVLLQTLKSIGIVQKQQQVYIIEELKNENIDEYNYDFINWLNFHKKELLEKNIVLIENGISRDYYTDNLKLEIAQKFENDWFDIKIIIKLDDFEIPFKKLKNNILQGKRKFQLPNGKIVILPAEWFKKMEPLLMLGNEIMGWIHISKNQLPVLEEIKIIEQTDYTKKLLKIYNKEYDIKNVPTTIKAKLRNYQQEGFSWLTELANENLGACLADDMGLGKTLQAICFIEDLKINSNATTLKNDNQQLDLFEQKKKRDFSTLVIVPTSLVYNWKNEIHKFAPQNKVGLYLGNNRDKYEFNNYDINITTYGIARNDQEQLSEQDFSLIILDESQYIKNPNSKIYHAISLLNAHHKITLTGTPIENSLSDLWAQMNFINPGLLGTYNSFKKNYLKPIEKHKNEEQKARFRKLVTPFILRRTKREVAKDLPELIEQTRFCVLNEEHQNKYEEEKSKIRNLILENEDDMEFWKNSKFQIFESISKLRQLANKVSFVTPESPIPSDKFIEIQRVIDEITQENHKVLIFSSYVKIIKEFESEFKRKDYNYSKIIGASSKKERERNIKEFETREDIKLFLISIKAGGVGLNLTAADYVIIIDPWWNPAVESQAINRAHRIGQKKNVIVYRFISKNTIEEKIKFLQNKKQTLSDEIIDFEKDIKLNPEEIKALFN